MYDSSLATKRKFEASILYVEDEENIRQILTKILLRKFDKVFTASNGAEGLKLYLEERPDIVITDIRMPEMSGLEMSKRIRAIDPEAIIVITTAFSDVEHFLDAINLGINRFIIKPIDSERLKETIYELLATIKKRQYFNNASELLKEYRKAVDASAIVSKTDKHGIITYVNDAFCEISGYSREELIGKSHNVVRHPLNPKQMFKEIWEQILAGDIWKGVIRNQKKDGSSYTVEATIVPICARGEIVEFIALRYDITELLAIQEALERSCAMQLTQGIQKASEIRTESLLETIPHATFLIDENDIITAFNKRAEALFCLAHKEWQELLKQKKLDFKTIMENQNNLLDSVIDWKQLLTLDTKETTLVTLQIPTPNSSYIMSTAPLHGNEDGYYLITLTSPHALDNGE